MGDGVIGKVIVAVWLTSLPILASCRVPAWASDRTLWAAAMTVAPQTRRVLGRNGEWGAIILRDEAPPLRQPFSTRPRPVR